MKIYVWWSIFCGATIFFLFRTLFLMPVMFFDKKVDKKRQKLENSEAVLLKDQNQNEQSETTVNQPEKPPVSNRKILEYVATTKFMAFVPWFLIMDLREKFFLQSVNPWLNWQGNNDQDFTSKYTDLFS